MSLNIWNAELESQRTRSLNPGMKPYDFQQKQHLHTFSANLSSNLKNTQMYDNLYESQTPFELINWKHK